MDMGAMVFGVWCLVEGWAERRANEFWSRHKAETRSHIRYAYLIHLVM